MDTLKISFTGPDAEAVAAEARRRRLSVSAFVRTTVMAEIESGGAAEYTTAGDPLARDYGIEHALAVEALAPTVTPTPKEY